MQNRTLSQKSKIAIATIATISVLGGGSALLIPPLLHRQVIPFLPTPTPTPCHIYMVEDEVGAVCDNGQFITPYPSASPQP